MPAYGALVIPPSLSRGDSYNVFNGDAVTNGEASERVAFMSSQGDSIYAQVAEILCDVAPTTMTVAYQVAETDVEAAYQTVNSVTIATPATSGRIDVAGLWSRFGRLKITALTGTPHVTASIGR